MRGIRLPSWASGDRTPGSQWCQPKGSASFNWHLLFLSQGSTCGNCSHLNLGKILGPFWAAALMNGSRKTGSSGRGEIRQKSLIPSSIASYGCGPGHILVHTVASTLVPSSQGHTSHSFRLAWALFEVVPKVDRDRHRGLVLEAACSESGM